MAFLTEKQFQTARPEGEYDRYLRYLVRHGGPKMKRKAERALRRRQGGGGGDGRGRAGTAFDWLASMGNPQALRAQARQDIMATIMPMIAEIERSFGRARSGALKSLSAYDRGLAGELRGIGPEVERLYREAQGQSAGIDRALTAQLAGAGTDVLAQLTQQLGEIGVPAEQLGTVAAPAAAFRTAGVGASALGKSTTQRLIAQGAAEAAEAAQLPALAAAAGKQARSQLERMYAKELADAIGQIRSQIPGMTTDLYRQLYSQEVDKAIARAGLSLDKRRLREERRQFDISTMEGRNREQQEKVAAREQAVQEAELAAMQMILEIGWMEVPNPDLPPGLPGSTERIMRPYREVYEQVRAMVEGRLRRYGVKPARIKKIIQRAMRAAGYSTTGPTTINTSLAGGSGFAGVGGPSPGWTWQPPPG